MIIKRIVSFVLLLILGVSIIGCGINDNEDTVVAKVNGEKITKGEFNKLYDQVKQNYYITEEIENDPEQKETIAEIKADILEQLIVQKLIVQKAKDAGFVVTDEILDQARTEFENIIAEVASQMEIMDNNMQDEQEEDTEDQGKDYVGEARAFVEEQLDAMGQTEDEYIELIAQQIVIDNYVEELVKDVNANEQEIQEYYEERLQIQKENISILAFEEVELYSPEEVRVKHVLIKLPQEDIDQYNAMVDEGKTEEADKYLDEKLKAIEPKAMEVLEKAQNGQEFEKLIEEYGEDPGMEDNDVGYIVRQDGSFVPQFEEAAFSLEEGEISDLVASSYGYHIIKLYEKMPEKVYTLEEKYDELEQVVSQHKKIDAWTVMLDEWLEKAEIKRYEGRL
ncbi:MAG: peptidylprolyl isomerase [Clostridiales bacterium]|nr:peptidylprolyl isomerase [Clostridiales bacterium]